MAEIDISIIRQLAIEINRLTDVGVDEIQRFLQALGRPLPLGVQWSLKMHFLSHFLICADTLNAGRRPNLQRDFMEELFPRTIEIYSDSFLTRMVADMNSVEIHNAIVRIHRNHVHLYRMTPSGPRAMPESLPDWMSDVTASFAAIAAQHIGEVKSQDVVKKILETRLLLDEPFWAAVAPAAGYEESHSRGYSFSESSSLTMGAVLEIHFYQQEDAYVFIESDAPDEDARLFMELLLLASYIVRQVSNLGPGEVSQSIGLLVKNMGASSTPLREGLARFDGNRLVPYSGARGRKRFTCQFQYTPLHIGLSLKAQGFGLLARGVGYYAQCSIVALTRFFIEKRPEANDTIDCLKLCLAMCGEFILQNQVGLNNHDTLVRKIAEALVDRD